MLPDEATRRDDATHAAMREKAEKKTRKKAEKKERKERKRTRKEGVKAGKASPKKRKRRELVVTREVHFSQLENLRTRPLLGPASRWLR